MTVVAEGGGKDFRLKRSKDSQRLGRGQADGKTAQVVVLYVHGALACALPIATSKREEHRQAAEESGRHRNYGTRFERSAQAQTAGGGSFL